MTESYTVPVTARGPDARNFVIETVYTLLDHPEFRLHLVQVLRDVLLDEVLLNINRGGEVASAIRAAVKEYLHAGAAS